MNAGRHIASGTFLGLALILAGPAAAELLVHESFNYAESSDIIGAACTGTGLTGDWGRIDTGTGDTAVLAGDLAYGELVTSGDNHVFTTPTTGSGSISVEMDTATIAALTPADGETKTAWMSCLTKRIQSLETRICLDRLTNPTGRLNYIRVEDDQWGVSGGYNNSVTVSEAVTANETYFYLVKFTFSLSGANETVTATGYRFSGGALPESEGALPGGVYSEQTSTNDRFPGRLTIYMPSSNYEHDEIRVGTTFEDVVVTAGSGTATGTVLLVN